MIITVTLNPAIDKTVYIDDFQVNEVNRIKSIRKDIGGKGINVSQNLNNLSKDNLCVSILGGLNGQFIKDVLIQQAFNFKTIEVEGEVRTNLKVVDLKKKTFTDINEPGFELSEKKAQKIIDSIVDLAKPDDILVLSGSVPKGFKSDAYQKIIENVECKTILDTSGDLFVKGLEANPYLIKPNIDELEEFLNIEKISGENEIVSAAEKLIKNGVEIVVVSLGAEGSIYVTADRVYKIEGKKVDIQSTVGAGDSMVAALAIALDEGYTIEDMAKFASAVSTASIMTEGSQPGDVRVIEELMNNGG
jgi:1-phosphofructokinase